MPSIRNVWRSLGGHDVLTGITFDVVPGTICGLIGPSGGGKSTLLKILAGVARMDFGTIDPGVANHDEIGLMFQEGALFDSLTVFDNIAFPLVHGRVPAFTLEHGERQLVHDKVEEILSRVGLCHAAYKYPGQLSGGMRRRISLARALVARPKLVLLDDPTAGLDPVASNVIMRLILDIHREYRPTMIVASHDLRRLFPAADTIVALFDGRVRFNGSLNALAADPCPELRRFVVSRYDLFTTDPCAIVRPHAP